MCSTNRFLLLQINDALFPIGGYSHSFGLETYIQKGIVFNAETAENYIESRLRYSLLYNELLAIRIAWDKSMVEDSDGLLELDAILEAGQLPREIREASFKLGSRFIKTLGVMAIAYESPIFLRYKKREKHVHYVTAYGAFCAATGICQEDALRYYLFAQTSAMVTNCVKSIPLSQSVGQKILVQTHPLLEELLVTVQALDEGMLCAGAPGFDIRCMQHENLYSRIYMS